ncbi:unnamed protein product [Darwinula stevensoni]|uniref:Peroxidase n=1 Tax=Darwinula stevensoni TaxID=69355 RepID=A0A7R9AF29_9CRUS|nr:unnamed protein product [Darwinula stevensoni]CAG0902879.1 unnamed protein product [Darwinula stevensoni]
MDYKILVVAILALTLAVANGDERDSISKATKESIEDAEMEYGKEMEALMLAGARSERPSFRAKTTPEAREIGKMARILRIATSKLAEKLEIPRKEAEYLVRREMYPWEKEERARSGAPPACCSGVQPDCASQDPRYRTYDGVCNNLADSCGCDSDAIYWGSAETYYRRINNGNSYDDGLGIPRGSGGSFTLPNPREVSNRLHGDADEPTGMVTHMVMQWGQFLDHDIGLTPNGDLKCCELDPSPEECFPIEIPHDDPFYSQLTVPQTCMSFQRSIPYCGGEVREQINMITAFIDGSSIYGSSESLAMKLRSHQDGKLVTNANDPGLLPTSDQILEDGSDAFLSGDIRVMENPGLQSLHTLFMREHNRLAEELKALNPAWDDERLFQEARKIIGAEMQNIHYGEFLPEVFGSSSYMEDYGLGCTCPSTYDPNLDPSLYNIFTSAAYRFGHSLVRNEVLILSEGGEESYYYLKDNYGNATPLLENGLAAILVGVAGQDTQSFDEHFADAVRNYLNRLSANEFGEDLVARGIQRGRDHGILGYNEYRAFCGIEKLEDWDSRPKEFSQRKWDILRSLYTDPDDLDMYSAGFLETPVADDAVIGPTHACYVADAFRRLKYGDRFFFTHTGLPNSFTPEQVQVIRDRKLSDVICDNSPATSLQPSVMRPVGNG